MLYLKHGGHIATKDDKRSRELSRSGAVTLASDATPDGLQALTKEKTFPFDYFFPEFDSDESSHLPADDPAKTVAALNALGSAMVEQVPAPAAQDAPVPPVYTYWGQFIDHDLTANTDRDSAVSDIRDPALKPLQPDFVRNNLVNLRRPGFDLDSVYGEGPAFNTKRTADAGFYDGIRFRVGSNTDGEGIPGVKIPPEEDLARDLPRIGPLLDAGIITDADLTQEQRDHPSKRTLAWIGDSRNDENLIVAQFHLAFLRFHNAVVERLGVDGDSAPDASGRRKRQKDAVGFERARQLVRWHYQWLVVHDFLKTVTLPGVVDKVLLGGPKHYRPRAGKLYTPLEFSLAAYRFGHSMVRAAYDFNRNFGQRLPGQGGGNPVEPVATFDRLFLFTGEGFQRENGTIVRNPFLGAPTLPFNWIIEWDRFIDKGSLHPTRFARKIDTHVAPPLTDMVNQGNTDNSPVRELLKHLARRNLLRGYLLSAPTGQSIAQKMGIAPLSEGELRQNNSEAVNAALDQGGFIQRTPLWYYVLKEAEVRTNGTFLGELGSRITCETIIGLLRYDKDSYLNARGGWDPSDGVKLPNGDPIVTIGDFLRFAGVAR
jgi:Animal haem peroxidase